jgi:diguanylate cyclase (GGDEF)-like protein
VSAARDAEPVTWVRALPCLEAVAGCIEAGLMVIDLGDRIVFASEWVASLFGLERAALERLSGSELVERLAAMVPDPPPMVRDRLLLAPDRRIVCEEFEIPGPARSVVRWVARRVSQPEPALVVVCTDITAEVDIASTRERHAVTDSLTSMLNRRGIEPQLFREMNQASRQGTPLGVVVLDIDHFKRVNDEYGHNVGDLVLREVGTIVSRAIRGSDVAARWGGEEFLVVLPGTDLEAAHCAAERIRAAVEGFHLSPSHGITVSAGVASYRSPERLAEMIARADRKLYEAKACGRNCVR